MNKPNKRPKKRPTWSQGHHDRTLADVLRARAQRSPGSPLAAALVHGAQLLEEGIARATLATARGKVLEAIGAEPAPAAEATDAERLEQIEGEIERERQGVARCDVCDRLEAHHDDEAGHGFRSPGSLDDLEAVARILRKRLEGGSDADRA